MSASLAAVYADGWNGAVVNPLSRAVAAERDASGDPYAVLLVDGRRVRVVVQVSWRDDYCGVVVFDGGGRRVGALDFRRTPGGGLFLRERRAWPRGEGAGLPRAATVWSLAGRREDVDEPAGDRGGSSRWWSDEAAPRVAAFSFGEWRDLLDLAGVGRPEVVDADGHRLPAVTSDEFPWRAPRPAEPRDFAGLFGGSFAREGAVVELIPAGTVRLTSGRIVAADPEVFTAAQPAFTVTVAPGAYPIVLAGVRFAERPERLRVAAARLAVSDAPVVRWEMALQEGQSLLDLGAGEFYGFGVDSGQASFADADAWEALAGRDLDGRDKWEDDWIEYGRIAAEQHVVVVDDGAMIAWPSGWGDGSYPVWIGYDSADRVACFVADMRL